MDKEPVEDFNSLLENCIRKAYDMPDLPSQEIRGLSCMIEGYVIFRTVSSMYKELDWRASFMHAAMRELYTTLDAGCWIGLLAALAKGGNECLGRKRFAFNSLIEMIVPNETAVADLTETASVQAPMRDAPEQILDESTRSFEDNSPLARSKQKLKAYFQNFIDEFKLKALKSGMMEPLKLYLWGTGGSDLSLMNAEVHDVNWMAALLLAALQVQLPILPYLGEVNITDVHYLATNNDDYREVLKELDKPEFFGYAFTATQLWKKKYHASKPQFERTAGESCWAKGSAQARATGAINPQATKESRQQVMLYLRRFMSFFRPDYLCEKLAIALTRDRSYDFEVVFSGFKREGWHPT
jgi:hypothetical protein